MDDNPTVVPTFKDIEPVKFGSGEFNPGGGYTPYRPGGVETFQIGSGNTIFNIDKQGMWMGDPRYRNAPFKVSMRGELIPSIIATQDGVIVTDQLGLHSINTFLKQEEFQDTDQTFTDVDWVAASSLVLNIADLPRPAVALIYVSVAGYHDDTTERLDFRLLLNANQQGQIFSLRRGAAATVVDTNEVVIPVILSQGDNTLLIEGKSTNANSGVLKGTVIPSVLGCLLLGK